jgi:alkanesulfonate monooxygenase SsuD/methylene tetrahydromethanopterin reductase-like flavin-dependent oxidoreductase (luciferase family)
MPRPRLGVSFRPQLPPEDVARVARHVESAGLDELWFWEDCFLEGGLTVAAAALAWTERIQVGVGLMPVPLRNPALAAMEIAAIARMFPERFLPGLGHGIQDWMGQAGARVASPMRLLQESTAAVGALLRGEPVETDGTYVRLRDVRLAWPPAAVPPLLLGGRGPRTLRLAGELADGLILDSGLSYDTVRQSVAVYADARAARGGTGPGLVVLYREVADPQDVPEVVEQSAASGATSVVLEAPADAPDPSALVDALAQLLRADESRP